MSGKRSRDKGARRERQVVQLYRDMGIHAQRVPLSGACEGFKGDVIIPLLGELQGEVKARGNGEGFRTIQTWLGDNDVLHLWVDRAKPLVVLPWSTWSVIAGCLKQYAELLDELEAAAEIEHAEMAAEEARVEPVG